MKKLVFLSAMVISMFSCGKKDQTTAPDPLANIQLPGLSTSQATNISSVAARLNGAINSEGGGNVMFRGFAWGLNANPTISDNEIRVDGSGVGPFFRDLTGLQSSTTYHVRAWASNEKGIAYGN